MLIFCFYTQGDLTFSSDILNSICLVISLGNLKFLSFLWNSSEKDLIVFPIFLVELLNTSNGVNALESSLNSSSISSTFSAASFAHLLKSPTRLSLNFSGYLISKTIL